MLKPETELVWAFLKDQPLLAGFILLGGSALALHLHHRFSEDLDFAYPAARLPRVRLDALRRVASAAGFDFEPHDDPTAAHEFENGGLDLADYQQDFVANRTVRVSFFAPEPALLAVLEKQPEGAGPRLAALDELFRSKSLLTASRSKTRDWFDLLVLMTRCGYSMKDYHEAFHAAGIADQATVGLQRLCSGKPQASDEGFEHLSPEAPSLAEMQRFFQSQRDTFERREAAQMWRKPKGP